MPARRDLPDELLRRARSRELTRANTSTGSVERAAVNRAERESQQARHPELTPRQVAGHARPGDVPPTISLYTSDPPGPRLVLLEGASRPDAYRAGKYMEATKRLTDLPLDSEEWRREAEKFERRFRHWKPVAGFKLLSDPSAVVALVEELRQGEDEVVFDSGRSRPGRRRRTR